MAVRMRDVRRRTMEELRFEPTPKRVRAMLGDGVLVDSTDAVLVWEPRRVLPSYAVPEAQLECDLEPSAAVHDRPADDQLLHGGFPFGVHSTNGEALTVQAVGERREDSAFRPADADLAGRVVLDFHAFDAWFEEDEPILAHPRDPFHRVDIRRGSRHVRVEAVGEVIAESSRPQVVFETSLPVRYYLPREDVRVALTPTDRITRCAYKGEAAVLSFEAGGSV